jgi:hypothetical protein
MRESTIETAVCAYAKSLGWLPMKLAGANDRGKPDRMFLKDGRVMFIEFKATGKLPTALQLRWLADLHERGFTAGWCNDIEKGKRMFNLNA